MQNKM